MGIRGSLVILGLAAFVASGAPARKKAGNAAQGKALFDEQCAVCHDDTGTDRKLGPELKGLFKRAKMADGKPVTRANVRARIHSGGNGMPAFPDLTAGDLDNLLAYLMSISR